MKCFFSFSISLWPLQIGGNKIGHFYLLIVLPEWEKVVKFCLSLCAINGYYIALYIPWFILPGIRSFLYLFCFTVPPRPWFLIRNLQQNQVASFKNADFWVPSMFYWIRISGVGSGKLHFNKQTYLFRHVLKNHCHSWSSRQSPPTVVGGSIADPLSLVRLITSGPPLLGPPPSHALLHMLHHMKLHHINVHLSFSCPSHQSPHPIIAPSSHKSPLWVQSQPLWILEALAHFLSEPQSGCGPSFLPPIYSPVLWPWYDTWILSWPT